MLLHFLSDQQWVRHWLVVVGAGESGQVLSTVHPLGALDGTVDLSVVADSLEEFLLRFWIENEIAFRTTDGQPLDEQLTAYAAALR